MSTIEDLKQLVDPATPPALSDADLQAILDASLIPDPEGLWPGQPGYITTYDLYWAAAEALTLRAARAASSETVTKVASEGTSFDVQAPNWAALTHHYRMRSQIGAQIGYGQTLGTVELTTADSGFIPASKGLSWT